MYIYCKEKKQQNKQNNKKDDKMITKRTTNIISITLILIGMGWMIVKGAYDLGYRKAMLASEDRVEWAIQETSDDLLVACEAKIDELNAECDAKVEKATYKAKIDGKNEILEQF